jgi:hypothetical protein
MGSGIRRGLGPIFKRMMGHMRLVSMPTSDLSTHRHLDDESSKFRSLAVHLPSLAILRSDRLGPMSRRGSNARKPLKIRPLAALTVVVPLRSLCHAFNRPPFQPAIGSWGKTSPALSMALRADLTTSAASFGMYAAPKMSFKWTRSGWSTDTPRLASPSRPFCR